jgi:hypothetical protein
MQVVLSIISVVAGDVKLLYGTSSTFPLTDVDMTLEFP